MLGIGLDMSFLINSFVFDSVDYSTSFLFITSPTPRTEVGESAGINISCEAENASSVEFEYKNVSGSWVSIGSGTNSSGDTWTYSSWSPTVNALAIKAIATYPGGSTQECENLLYSLSMYDTFTDTNGTAIGAHTSDDVLGSSTWTVDSGDWEISSNQLVNDTADSNTHVIYHDCGSDDFVFEFQPDNFRGVTTLQVVFRYTDSDNYLLFFVNSPGLPILRERYSASNTDLYTGSNGDVSDGDVIKIIVRGDYVTLFIVDEPVFFGTIPNITTGSNAGFRRGGAASNTSIDYCKIMPIGTNPIDSSVSYSATKNGTMIYAKNQDSPNDTNGLADFDIVTVGSTNYLIYATQNSSGDWAGIYYATSSTSTPHSWTLQGQVLSFTTESVAGVGAWWDGSQWDLIYTDRDTGIMYHASGASLGSMTKNGAIKNLTGSSIYLRQGSIIKEGSTWYVFTDVRIDQPSGEFGYVGLMQGSSFASLSDPIEVLTNLGEDFDTCNITAVSVKKEGDYYEMFYGGYAGRDGTNFHHEIGLAISKNIEGKFKRVSNDPLVGLGAGTLDDITVNAPCRLPNTSILYYQVNGTGTAGGNDGYTYATLS